MVYYPSSLDSSQFQGDLFGYYHSSTGIYNLTAYGQPNRSESKIGRIIEDGGSFDTEELIGLRKEGVLRFYRNGNELPSESVNLIQDVFSRTQGILESSVMVEKRAVISGCGSVGSLVALELARSGVGHFLLIDNDTISYHNICRHQCGISDVGRRKVDAVADRILDINPTAEIVRVHDIIELVPKETFDQFCLGDVVFVGCADNREGDVYGSQVAMLYGAGFVSIGLWERAFAGEIFYVIPESGDPCYVCPFGAASHSLSNRTSTSRRVYTTEEDLSKVNFEPGISVDIGFVTNIAIKLILDILNRKNPGYVARLLGHLAQYTLICNTNDPRVGGDQAEIFAYPLQVTTSIGVQFRPPCPPCRFSDRSAG